MSNRTYFVDRDFLQTPRACAICMKPGRHRVRKSNTNGDPDNSSMRVLCDACAPGTSPEQGPK